MDPFIGGLITTGISSLFGGLAGQSQADAANKAAERQYAYNMQAWKYGKKSIKADWRHSVKQWEMNQSNEETLGAWKDATNLQDWQQALKIQDFEYRSQMRQYAKSEKIYGQQLTFNNMAAEAAREAEKRKLEDAVNEIAYQNQDIVIKAMQAEGMAAVKGQVGNSADKGEQANFAALGRNQAILFDSLLSAKADTQAALRKIASDKFGADLAADAARMLQPERLPQPPKPLRTPRAEFLKPRKPKKFDFGPKPIKGATASSTGSWLGAGAEALTGIVGAATSGSKYNFGFGSPSSLGSRPITNQTQLAFSGIKLI
jgi:hypothetical protein